MSTETPKLPKMSASNDVCRVLCREQNPIAARYFDEENASLFLIPGAPGARIEVYPSNEPWTSTPLSKDEQDIYRNPKTDLAVGDSPTTNDEHPKLSRSTKRTDSLVSITEIEHLKRYVGVQSNPPIFFIRQRFSYSALSITFSQFETLLNLKNVSPQFKDYVTYMGERKREV